MDSPRLRNAISCSRRDSVSKTHVVVSKTWSSGQNVIIVPVSSVRSPFLSGPAGSPTAQDCRQTCPSLRISTSSLVDSALTTETPTPCRPPETAYDLLSNLPPACSVVITTSTAGLFSPGWLSTGMPRPLSHTLTPPSASNVTSIRSQYPASASSTALSTTSWTR